MAVNGSSSMEILTRFDKRLCCLFKNFCLKSLEAIPSQLPIFRFLNLKLLYLLSRNVTCQI